jgi:hypothetical protein
MVHRSDCDPQSLELLRSCGPVWCARRGRSAVVSLVSRHGHPVYVQWCSLVGVDLVCDEACVCAGARWVTGEGGELTREIYTPLRALVAAVESRLDAVDAGCFLPWRDWARTFTAGVCSASAAWRAAEAARSESIGLVADGLARHAGLAAEDAAWAVAHAAAGNLALSLQRSAAARQLLKAVA